jgi:hypothetical protein
MSGRPAQSKAGATFFRLGRVREGIWEYRMVSVGYGMMKGVHWLRFTLTYPSATALQTDSASQPAERRSRNEVPPPPGGGVNMKYRDRVLTLVEISYSQNLISSKTTIDNRKCWKITVNTRKTTIMSSNRDFALPPGGVPPSRVAHPQLGSRFRSLYAIYIFSGASPVGVWCRGDPNRSPATSCNYFLHGVDQPLSTAFIPLEKSTKSTISPKIGSECAARSTKC